MLLVTVVSLATAALAWNRPHDSAPPCAHIHYLITHNPIEGHDIDTVIDAVCCNMNVEMPNPKDHGYRCYWPTWQPVNVTDHIESCAFMDRTAVCCDLEHRDRTKFWPHDHPWDDFCFKTEQPIDDAVEAAKKATKRREKEMRKELKKQERLEKAKQKEEKKMREEEEIEDRWARMRQEELARLKACGCDAKKAEDGTCYCVDA